MTLEGDRTCCWERQGGGDGEDHEEVPNCRNYSSGGWQHESLEYLPSRSSSSQTSLTRSCQYTVEPLCMCDERRDKVLLKCYQVDIMDMSFRVSENPFT